MSNFPRALIPVTAAVLILGLMAGTVAAVDPVFPSTNDVNRTNGWAHFNVLSVGRGEATVEFVSTRGFASCFEYRTDGDISQKIGDTNYNTLVTDGLYPFECVSNSTESLTLEADEYVEVRMAFGAEGDERFDWTRFEVLPDAERKADCKKGGWKDFDFRNQGQCIKFVVTGVDRR